MISIPELLALLIGAWGVGSWLAEVLTNDERNDQ